LIIFNVSGGSIGDMKSLSIVFTLFFLVSCTTTLPLHVHEDKNIEFIPTKTIYLETDSEIVDLSSRLKQKLINAKFNVTNRRKDAGYILAFDYTAKFDVSPWVFRSFNLKMSDAVSGDILYSVNSGRSGSEPVESVMKKAVSDMANKLLLSRQQAFIALAVDRTKSRELTTEDIDIDETRTIYKAIDSLGKEQQKTQELIESRKKAEEILKKIEPLRKKNENLKEKISLLKEKKDTQEIKQYNETISDNQQENRLIYTIQTGSFINIEHAQKQFKFIIQSLSGEELNYLRIEKIGNFHTVRFGKFEDYATAEKFLQALESKLSTAIILNAYIKDDRIIKLYNESISSDR
jgi:hypothetical protein